MWIMLSDCFISVVSKDCAEDELMVRARRPGDIEKLFPDAVVTEYTASDYHYRAAVKKTEIKIALVDEVNRVTYDNFKDSVDDVHLHNAYMRVWTAMATLQPQAPYSGKPRVFPTDGDGRDFENPLASAKPATTFTLSGGFGKPPKKPPAKKKRNRPEQMR